MNYRYLVIGIVALCSTAILAATVWVGADRIKVFTQYEQQDAFVVSCTSKHYKRKRTATRRGISSWSYSPIAVGENGDKAVGYTYLPEKSWCNALIGQPTTILVSKEDPSDTRINSFTQMWLLPAVIFYLAIALMTARRPPQVVATMFAAFAVCVGGLIALEFGWLNSQLGRQVLTHDERSELSLKHCIEKAMAEQGVNYRGDLKKLNCVRLGLTDISDLSQFTGLEELYLQSNDIASLEPLRSLGKLRTLRVHGNRRLTSLSGLEGLTALEVLGGRSMQINNIEAIRKLTQLRYIDLSYNQIEDVSAMSNMNKLELVLVDRNPISDASPFSNKPQLERVSFYGSKVSDISALFGNTALKIVGVRGEGNIACSQVDELRRRLSAEAKVYGPKSCD